MEAVGNTGVSNQPTGNQPVGESSSSTSSSIDEANNIALRADNTSVSDLIERYKNDSIGLINLLEQKDKEIRKEYWGILNKIEESGEYYNTKTERCDKCRATYRKALFCLRNRFGSALNASAPEQIK